MGEMIKAGGAGLWVEHRGQGPDVLLIAGLSDPAEAWTAQLEGLADRWRLTAFDNRGAGRSPLPDPGAPFTVATMADDAAAILAELAVPAAHVLGFSGGSAVAQELALRHPQLVRSLVLVGTWARLDPYGRALTDTWRWMADLAPGERAALEAFFLWIYTPRAHADGTVDQLIAEALAFPHPQPPEAFKRQLDAFLTHDTLDRLHRIDTPTLVVAGELDIAAPPRLGRQVADGIPGAEFRVLPGEAHQPFQESPGPFNRLVDTFWSRVEAGAADRLPVG
jgi:pimeloyl-ACP methyl ester carboxylesterase